ncbi:unnamed protein product [Oncorhynchus mykiss]|uniref:LIM zinc-binding domain-containing protein n=1 Tax=Oncorhynchus mykiss TaxID=8022 RepID=A0A060W8T9_ONCMY|nr:unnamed protein product [Oncorhynchus mykiss]
MSILNKPIGPKWLVRNQLFCPINNILFTVCKQGSQLRRKSGHSECFVCCSCQKPLAGTRFTSHEEKAFCVDCYKTTVAKKGSGCQNPITGFVKATNVVNYEGSSWHEYYFNCKKCSLSVANKCIVANSRDIFCSECAKKL